MHGRRHHFFNAKHLSTFCALLPHQFGMLTPAASVRSVIGQRLDSPDVPSAMKRNNRLALKPVSAAESQYLSRIAPSNAAYRRHQ
jgi:hypothetical protein